MAHERDLDGVLGDDLNRRSVEGFGEVEGDVCPLSGGGEGFVVQLQELVGVEGFEGVGFAVAIDEFDFKDFGFVDFHDRAHLALKQAFLWDIFG